MFGTLKVPETPVKSTEHGSEKCERTTSFELRTVWGEMIEDDDLYHPAYYTVSDCEFEYYLGKVSRKK